MLAAVAAQQGIESELIPKMATAFCSGMAQTGGICGALSGAILGLSLVEGRTVPEDPRERLYRQTQSLVKEFSTRFEAHHCPDLIHLDLSLPDASEQYQIRELKTQCEVYIRWAAGRAAVLLSE